jgi:tetratricopeptide (TPR) repeat protein
VSRSPAAASPGLQERAKRATRATESTALAAQHLLRHLDDPQALSRNPLVASLFDQGDGMARPSANILRHLHDAIRQCAEQLRADATSTRDDRESRERQYQILIRCDLGREPHTTVASDLALSRRQFYRERRAASEYLAHFLAEIAKRRAARPRAISVDRFLLENARAKYLRLAGEAERAQDALREIVASADDIGRKIGPWCTLIELLINCNRIGEAEAELDAAQQVIDGARGQQQSQVVQSQLRIDMQRASYYYFQGLMREAAEVDQRLEGSLVAMSRSASPELQEFFVATRVRQSLCDVMSGTVDRARTIIDEVGALLAAQSEVLPDLRATYLITSGSIKDNALGGSTEAFNMLSEALGLAQSQGLTYLVIEAMSALANNAQGRGDFASGMRYIAEILPVAERFALPAQHGMLLNAAAMSEATLGHHEAAVGFASRARDVLAPNSLENIYSSLAEAQARVSTHGYALAARAAREAYEAASRIRSDRLAGTALRLLAESSAGLGRAEDAREYALAAVARLESDGPPVALLQAYQAAGRITGDRRLRSRAAELASALRR